MQRNNLIYFIQWFLIVIGIGTAILLMIAGAAPKYYATGCILTLLCMFCIYIVDLFKKK